MIIAGNKILFIDGETGIKIMQALSNETRLLMLSLLSHSAMNLSSLAESISLPQSTTAFHLKQLEEAGLVNVQYKPGSRGQQKMVSKRYDEVRFKLPGVAVESDEKMVEVTMPVGNYTKINTKPTCGLATDVKYIGMIDDPRSFYEPKHVFAQILWFRQGFVEYDFPNNIPYGSRATEIEISMELCSEAPEYNLDWPSDITLSLNGVEVGTWTCPSDFGGTKGYLTPEWWLLEQTQYGVLKRWRISAQGCFIDGEKVSDHVLNDFRVDGCIHLGLRIEVKENARNVGGINLFGKRFGNYAQDIVMRIHYDFCDGGRSCA